MRFALTVFAALSVAFTAAGAGQSAERESARPPFTITISALNPSFKAGSHVELRIVMTNTSNQDIDAEEVFDGSIDASYKYDVLDEQGNPAPRKNLKGPYTPNVRMRILKPGESTSEVTNVAKWVDFSQPGEYQIQVSRYIGDDEKDGVVKSNTIIITITG